ncbi:ABC transporter permease [Carboxylicivirga sp. RSCT41]|uniref:ABC transporter permease n=1 Tax=Carboxylicivirga agarovorans TaxID=3417570 RepID=UPI003D325807
MNYFKSILTGLRSTGRTTAFNLVGLSISFAVFMLLAVYLFNEYTYDSYNKRADQLYLLESHEISRDLQHPFLPNPIGDLLESNIPEIQSHCTLKSWGGTYSIKDYPDKTYGLNLYTADSTFTELFTLNIVKGNRSPFQQKNTIVLSESCAEKIFGEADPIGQVLMRGFKEPATVTAVYEDLPVNNSLHNLDGICSFIDYNWVNDWSEWSFFTYLYLPPNVDKAVVEKKISEIKEIKEKSFDSNGNLIRTLHLTAMPDVRFNSMIGRGNEKLAQTLLVVAFLLIIMAFVNFLNFSIASLPKKVKAISLRKISGASNHEIFLQGFADTALLISIAYVVGIGIALTILKIYPDVYGYAIVLSDYKLVLFLSYLLLLLIGAVVTFFPTRLLLVIEPALGLKSIVPFSVKSGKSRHILPVLQYVVAAVLIAGVVLINKQIDYVKNYDLGFDKENILVVSTTGNIRKQEQAFVNELLKSPNITDYAFSQFVPGGVGMGWGREVDGKDVNFKSWPVDERYMDFMDFEIIEGRPFSSNIKADENKFIFNEAAVKTFGWEGEVIGKQIPGMGFQGEIVGVVKDMKYASLYDEVEPMCFWLTTERHNKISLRISGENVSQTIKHVKQVYSSFETNYPIDYAFLDKDLDMQYKQSEKQAELISFACIVAIIIAAIGTLGMVIFSCEYRIKEVGIRKTNGASVVEIVQLINRSFVIQTIIALVIACPVAWYVMQQWLEGFAYKTEVSWWIFALTAIVTLSITLMTVSWQSWRAARRNPVEALRYE